MYAVLSSATTGPQKTSLMTCDKFIEGARGEGDLVVILVLHIAVRL